MPRLLWLLPLVLLGRAAAGPALPAGPPPLCPLYDPSTTGTATAPARPAAVGAVTSVFPPLRVHYCHASLRDLAQRVLAQAVRSYRMQVDGLGFAPPRADGQRGGGPELDIYLVNLGRAGRAQANDEPKRPDSAQAGGYIVIDHTTSEAHGFLASYVAHEMQHVLQYALSRRVADWFMEATAAYIDDLLYPEADVLPAMVADFQRAPYHPLSFHDGLTCYDYGAALFISYLVQRHGLGLIRQVFARGRADPFATLLQELPRRGVTLDETVREFARWRTRTGRFHRPSYFPGGQRFPEVTLDRALSPFEFLAAPIEISPQHPPEELGTTYVGLDLTTPLAGGLAVDLLAAAGPGVLAAELLSSDESGPLDAVVLVAGDWRTLRASGDRLRPGARLWLAVTQLWHERRPAGAGAARFGAQAFVARFRRLP